MMSCHLMNKGKLIYLLYQKDFSEKGRDRYFTYEDGFFSEVESSDIISLDSTVVTHDYWLIASSLYKKHQTLPKRVLDINLLSRIVDGKKAKYGNTQTWDVSKKIAPLFPDIKDFSNYMSMFYRRNALEKNVYMLFSHKLVEYTEKLLKEAVELGELKRFYDLELPIFNLLSKVVTKGVPISQEILKSHKSNIKSAYYQGLKSFAETHNVLYELPIEGDVKDKLWSLGYDVENYNTDYLIQFLPSPDGYTKDLKSLQKISKNYKVLNSISLNTKRLTPMVETCSTSTSRIYYKSPSVQNLSGKYRDLFVSDESLVLSYVDYDQFEIGIMAALSDDKVLKGIYSKADAYDDFSKAVFNNVDYRKNCKVFFLSYTYGMSIENILNSVKQLGGSEKAAKEYLNSFKTFETWKESLYVEYKKENRIETICGNYLNRSKDGDLTKKEKRSVVSHVVQGTGSYIFKSALLELSQLQGVEILITMHDAVLVQHPKVFDTQLLIKVFQDNMTSILNNKVIGKASIEEFFKANEGMAK